MRNGRLWLLLLAAWWLIRGCPGLLHFHQGDLLENGPLTLRLIERLGVAKVYRDTTELDLGKPLPTGTLVRGWSWNERWPDGGDGNWAVAPEAELRFPLLARLPRRLLLWMAGPPKGSRQRVSLELNGVGIGRLELAQALAQYEVRVPAEALREGDNRLKLRFERLEFDGERHLAAVVDKLLIKPDAGEAELRLRPEQVRAQDFQAIELPGVAGRPAALSQPGDSWLEFALLPMQGAELRFLRQAEAAGSDAVATASVEICPEAGECRTLARMGVYRPEPPDWVEERAALPELEAGPALLRFRVETKPSAWGSGWPGQIWGEPRVCARASASSGQRASGPLAEGWGGGASQQAPARQVILYLVDTLRADAVMDPELDLPNVRRFLGQSQWWLDAWANSTWTRPSVASLFTSKLPSTHGAQGRQQRIQPGTITLAGWLRGRGVTTGAVVGNGNVAAEFGFGEGFGVYRHLFGTAPEIHRAALDWLAQVRGRRAFAYVHVTEPHDPYSPLPPWSRLAEEPRFQGNLPGSVDLLESLNRRQTRATERDLRHLRALYRAETRQWDEQFGEFLESLEKNGLLQSTSIVLVSDHGEEFEEHGGWLHGTSLEPEQARVLLAIRSDGVGGLRPERVSLLDVAPTLCRMLGEPASPDFAGRPLDEPGSAAPVILELELDGLERQGLLGDVWDYSFSEGVNHDPKLYASHADPGHCRNLADALPITSAALEQELLASRARRSRAADTNLSRQEIAPETLEHLRALGYLGP